MPAENMFGDSSPSAWETEAPFELSDIAMVHDLPTGNQAIGKIMFVAIVLVVGFLIFVAARNGWSISPTELPSQISFAFSNKTFEELPSEVENLDTTVESKRIVVGDDKTNFLSVEGEIVNNNSSVRNDILLRAQLIDTAGNVQDEARFPCGKTIDTKVIQATAKGAISGHYTSSGKLYNCHISPNSSTIFQAIFENVPANYDASFSIEVTPVAANL